MRDVERRKLDKFERQDAFMVENAAEFPSGSPGSAVAVVNKAIITEMRSHAAGQISGGTSAAQSIGNKDEDLDELMQMLRNMNRAANAFEDEVSGSHLKFRLPRNRSEPNVLATARAYYADSELLKEKFIEYGLAGDFREALLAKLTSVEQSGALADTGTELRAGATGGLLETARRGMDNSRKMDAIIRIKYFNNPHKLAAWTVASHLERSPQRAKDSTGQSVNK
ncbi:MAG TPA: hypothetical protein VGC76_07065 [Pyrinomonadaceae bacterium]|jgi:hypothetical protein